MTSYAEDKIHSGIEDHLTGVEDPWYWTVKKGHVIGLGWRGDTNNGEGIVAYERRAEDVWQYVSSFIIRDYGVFCQLQTALVRFVQVPLAYAPDERAAVEFVTFTWDGKNYGIADVPLIVAQALRAKLATSALDPTSQHGKYGISFIHEGKSHTVYADDDEARDALWAKLSVAQNIHSDAMLRLRVKNLEAELADKGTALERETAKQEALEKELSAIREDRDKLRYERINANVRDEALCSRIKKAEAEVARLSAEDRPSLIGQRDAWQRIATDLHNILRNK